jgi:hypothetical protein
MSHTLSFKSVLFCLFALAPLSYGAWDFEEVKQLTKRATGAFKISVRATLKSLENKDWDTIVYFLGCNKAGTKISLPGQEPLVWRNFRKTHLSGGDLESRFQAAAWEAVVKNVEHTYKNRVCEKNYSHNLEASADAHLKWLRKKARLSPNVIKTILESLSTPQIIQTQGG